MNQNSCVQPPEAKSGLGISGSAPLGFREALNWAALAPHWDALGHLNWAALPSYWDALGHLAEVQPLQLYMHPGGPEPPRSRRCASLSQLMVPEEGKSKPRLLRLRGTGGGGFLGQKGRVWMMLSREQSRREV